MSEKIDQAIKLFRKDWVSHLGNFMSSESADIFVDTMKRVITNPSDPHEYLLAALYREDDQ